MQSAWGIWIYFVFAIFISFIAARRKGILTGVFFFMYICLVSFVFIVISSNFTTNGLVIAFFAFLSPIIAFILIISVSDEGGKVVISKQK
ncbi:hypothetical protein P8M88_004546 [Escherichia coli]|uniref:hypothetical protein n=1 Tax=Escherichia coli TaxID=562 RepID=UPI00107F9885|nr:hypothetical protein [Escherichia coli]EGI3980210.1 hypothetical protein [Escherichia coli]EGI3994287.1 hypothetical protein [Escherichia coli]EGI3999229.1 hypothetical protein [Escherichia coli]EGI4004108.1 hypothetical protein [Escherichia coli]EGI4009192.1 hypothetical protein [Escherichia coli]